MNILLFLTYVYIRYITDETAVTAYQCYRKLCSGQCCPDYVRNGILAYYLLSTVQYILYKAFCSL